ncbi:MAG: hypothetical protein E7138_04255 [Rikenellaceae bacterium]|nr:hypothetical protein [Rikenellaceae bacterium]
MSKLSTSPPILHLPMAGAAKSIYIIVSASSHIVRVAGINRYTLLDYRLRFICIRASASPFEPYMREA